MRIPFEFLTTIVFSMLHQYLSTRKNWLLGGIVPFLYILYFVGISIFDPQNFKIGSLISFILYLLIIWIDGRKDYRKKLEEKSKQELTKESK